MSRSTRTFIAAPVAGETARRLGRIMGHLRQGVAGARWSHPADLHLTLAFLGEVDDDRLLGLCKAVAEAVADLRPIDRLGIAGLGVFPNAERPRVMWAGVEGPGLAALGALHRRVVEAAAGAGHPVDDPRFNPHVTLAMLKTPKGAAVDLSATLAPARRADAGAWGVAEVVTYASTRPEEGQRYARLATAPLLAKR